MFLPEKTWVDGVCPIAWLVYIMAGLHGLPLLASQNPVKPTAASISPIQHWNSKQAAIIKLSKLYKGVYMCVLQINTNEQRKCNINEQILT